MTTKDQERKALAQIRKIVEGLGENSYIGMAFEGCFDIAEENIDNDFGCSMKQRADAAERRFGECLEIRREQEKTIADLKKQIECDKAARAVQDGMLKEELDKLRKAKSAAAKDAMAAVREIHLELTSGEKYDGRFTEARYNDSDGFRFITVIDPIGWAQSYKLDDIKNLTIN